MGCGASTSSNVADTHDAPEKKPDEGGGEGVRTADNAGTSPSASPDGRRKTMTVRRQAVSAEIGTAKEETEVAQAAVEPKEPEIMASLIKALAAHPLFEFLSDPLRVKVAERMHAVKGVEGEDIIVQGDPGDNFYLVHDGKYEAYGKASGEALVTYNPGDGFGELALLYNSPRAASVRCTQAGTLYALGRITFRKEVMEHNSGVKVGLERFLTNVPDLQGLEESQISKIANVMEAKDFSDGEYIVSKNEEADSLYLILSGEVVCHSEGGDEEMLRLSEGQFFGESALKELEQDRKRQANVVAVGQVRVGQLSREDFKTILGSLSEVFAHNFNRKVLEGVELLKPLKEGEREALLDILEEMVLSEGDTVPLPRRPPRPPAARRRSSSRVVVACHCVLSATNDLTSPPLRWRFALPVWHPVPSYVSLYTRTSSPLPPSLSSLPAVLSPTPRHPAPAASHPQAIEEGTTGTHFYIIKTGGVRVMKEGAQIAELKAGDHFGERALLTAEPTAATVIALERTELMALGKAKFDEALGPLEDILQKERAEREREAERAKVAPAPVSVAPALTQRSSPFTWSQHGRHVVVMRVITVGSRSRSRRLLSSRCRRTAIAVG